MKRRATLFASLWLSLLLVSPSFAGNGFRKLQVVSDLNHESGKLGTYRALVIGIDDYRDPRIPDLKTAVNDAKAMADVLKKRYGFKVQLLLNKEATRKALYQQLRRLAGMSKRGDSVLIYYAGHGDLDRQYNDGWWIPVDAKAGDPVTYLDNIQVQKAMRNMKARHVLLVSDSCYSGTLFGQARALPPVITDKYYLALYNEKSRWGMTSGNKTPVSDDGTGGHSVFAYQLIKELNNNDKPFLSTQEVYTRIAPVIANNSAQTPLCRPILNTGDQGGEFVFVASLKKDTKPEEPGTGASTMDKEMLFWQSIQDSRSPKLFKAYLEAFPNGVFAPIARQKIESMKEKPEVASIPPEISKSRLFVQVEPSDARVRILNIKPRFQQGMALDPGNYHVEVSSAGYVMKRVWTTLEAGRDKTLDFKLERKQVESQKQPVQVASLPQKPAYSHPSQSSSNIVDRDGVYVAYANGNVRDTSTGLEWKVGPDKDMNWNEARSWVQSLGSDWRMPTTDELKDLYNKRKGDRNMTPLLKTTGWWVWSGETRGSSDAGGFPFGPGHGYWRYRGHSTNYRAFAVRSRGEPNGKKVEAASLSKMPSTRPPSSTSSNIIDRDGIYEAYANGIVKDTNTGLEWKAGLDRDMKWNEARSWVQGLGSDWRMPTMDELAGLYNKGKGDRNMTPLLKTTGWWVWSSGTVGSSDAGTFNFSNGYRYWDLRGNSGYGRAFAVRSRGDG